MVNWKQDMVLGVVLLVLAKAFYFTGTGYPDGTFLFPSHLAPILGILACLLIISALRRREPGQNLIYWKSARGPVLLVLLTAAFILILPYLGFIPSCFLLSSSIFFTLGYPNKKVALLVALVASVAIYLVFHTALDVSLPMGSLLFDE
ncbi:MAG: hypothetical protein DELT_02676 [Desulfovibrio sp.]